MIILGLALGLFLGGCAVSEKTYTRTYEESFDAVTGIEIEARFLNVSYEGREGATEVELHASLEAPENSGLDIKFRKSGSKLKVEVVGQASSTGVNFGQVQKGFIHLTGPEGIKLMVNSSSGNVEIRHVRHELLEVKTSSGSISVWDLEVEDLRLTSSSGSMRGEELYGTVQTSQSSGSLRLSDVVGNVSATSSSGSMRLNNVEGRVDAQSSSGSMNFDGVGELGELRVSSGSIRAERSGLGEATVLKSSSGSIRIQTVSDLKAFNFDLSAGSGSVRVGESSGKKVNIDNGAAHTIRASSGSGSIRISN